MKRKMHLRFSFLSICLLMVLKGLSVNRVWTGAINSDFNNVGNWTGGGALSATDNFSISLTASATITLSANITVNDLIFTMNTGSGAPTGKLRVLGNTLTINGLANFNAPRYSSPVSFEVVKLDVSTGGSIIFNGQFNLHTTGSGDTYLTTNDLTGSTGLGGGTVYFNAGVSVGAYGRTVGGYEPDMVYNSSGAQTLIVKSIGGAYMFKGHNIAFGSTNAPVVTIRGIHANYFDSYDGNITIGANTTVIVPDSSIVGRMTQLDRYSSGGGTFSMGAGSILKMGCPNDGNGSLTFPPKVIGGFSTYALNATSTVWYNSTGWQSLQPITYGYLIVDGAGNGCDKYTTGAFTVQSDWTIQGSCIFRPMVTGSSATIFGNTLIQTSAILNASNDNVHPNNTYTFKGNFTNNSSWTNGSTVGVSTSIFDGTANQTIGGSVSTNFYHLTCNKASGTLYLGINTLVGVTTGGVMNFQAGPMNLNGFRLTINDDPTTAVIRTSGYAISEQNASVNNSIIQWNINTTTGAHVFPFGRADGTYIPVTFNNTGAAGNVSIATRRTINACASPCTTAGGCNLPWAGASNVGAVGNMTSGFIPDASCSAVIDRWWDITSSLASPLAAPVSLSFTYVGDENTMATPNSPVNIQHWNGTVWNAGTSAGTASGTYVNTGSTGVNAGTQTVGGSGFVNFSPYILSGNNTPLPIELLGMDLIKGKGYIDINWSTASEKNNAMFTVERSQDGINFNGISDVPGQNSSNTERNYSVRDNNPLKNISYYRVKQTDNDGSTSYTAIKSVNYTEDIKADYNVVPNPSSAQSAAVLSFNSINVKEISIVITDVVGKMVFKATENLQKDTYQLPQLLPGVYYIDVHNSEISKVQKMIIR